MSATRIHDSPDTEVRAAKQADANAFRRLLKFALPICAGNILYPLCGSLTTIWVGRYLGESAFAISLNGNLVVGLMLAVIIGLATATGVLVAQQVGAQNAAGAAGVIRAALPLHLGCTGLLVLLGWWKAPAILQILGLTEQQMPDGVPYLRVLIFAIFPISILQLINALLRSYGDSRTGFNAVLLASILNVLLNPVLIFGLGGLPRQGVIGAAAAEGLAYLLSLIFLVLRLYKRADPLIASLRTGGGSPVENAVQWIAPRGIAIGMQSIIVTVSAIGVTVVTNRLGSHITAAFGAAAQLWGYIQMPAFALAAGVTSLGAQAIGAGDREGLKQLLRAAVQLLMLSTVPLILLVYLLDDRVLRAFLPEGSPVLPLAVQVNSIVLWSYLLHGLTLVLLGICRSAGAVLMPLLITAAGLIGFRFAIVLAPVQLDTSIVAWSIALSMSACTVLALCYYCFGRWHVWPNQGSDR